MKCHRGTKVVGVWIGGLFAVLLVSASVPATTAQEPAEEQEAEAPEQAGSAASILIETEVWVAQPTGLEYFPATMRDSEDPASFNLLQVDHRTHPSGRYHVAYTLPGNPGTIGITYIARSENDARAEAAAGEFVFGEIAVNPDFAGYANDGLSDRFEAGTRTRLQDWRLTFSRTAFRTPHTAADWSVGWTRVKHIRDMSVAYRAVLPELPAFVPPLAECPQGECPNVLPLPDLAQITSTFEGRGVTGGIDVDFHLWQEKIVIETGVHLAVLRGSIAPDYESTTSAYICKNVCGPPLLIAEPPYDFFADPLAAPGTTVADQVYQQPLTIGVQGQSLSTTSLVVEAEVGLRWRALSWLEVFGGIRDTRYDNVGLDLRPQAIVGSLDATGFTTLGYKEIDETRRSVTYEGFYGGLAFRLK